MEYIQPEILNESTAIKDFLSQAKLFARAKRRLDILESIDQLAFSLDREDYRTRLNKIKNAIEEIIKNK